MTAAVKLFSRQGVKETTVGDVADAVRLSRSLVYTYFKDLDHLLCSVVLQAITLLKQEFKKALEGIDNGLNGIDSIGRAYVRFAVENLDYYQSISAFQAYGKLDPFKTGETASDLDLRYRDDAQHLSEIAQEINEIMANQISHGITDGSIRADVGHPFVVALSLWAQTSGLIQFAVLQEKALLAETGIGKTAFLEQGILLIRQSLKKL